MDFILAIAALCAIPNGGTYLKYVANKQLECQQYYIKCAQSAPNNSRLADCILKKPTIKD